MKLMGRSTDKKPENSWQGYPIVNASMFLEMDTGNRYWYDEENHRWVLEPPTLRVVDGKICIATEK